MVCGNLCSPHIWKSAVPSLGIGSGLVHGCVRPYLDSCRCRVQDDKSKRKPLEGINACDGPVLCMSSLHSAFKRVWLRILPVYILQRLKSLCSPSEEWHPYLDVHRGDRYSEDQCRRGKSHETNLDVDVNVISSSWL